MNAASIWNTIRTNPYCVSVWTFFTGALGEQIFTAVQKGGFDWSTKNIEGMLTAAAGTTIIALVHLYTPQPSVTQANIPNPPTAAK